MIERLSLVLMGFLASCNMQSTGGGDGDADVDTDADTDSDAGCDFGEEDCQGICFPLCGIGEARNPATCVCEGAGDSDADTDGDTDSDSDTDTGPAEWTEFDVGISTAHPYANSVNQNWTVDPPVAAASIELYITGFDMEPCCDHLYVYDRAGGVLLDQYEGYGLGAFTLGPYDYPSLYLNFTTDSSVTAYGFDIDTGSYMPE